MGSRLSSGATQEPPCSDAVGSVPPRATLRNIEDKRARERTKEAGTPKGVNRKAHGKLVEGSTVNGWKAALGELAMVYPDRINHHL